MFDNGSLSEELIGSLTRRVYVADQLIAWSWIISIQLKRSATLSGHGLKHGAMMS